jgi:hypothetical protein
MPAATPRFGVLSHGYAASLPARRANEMLGRERRGPHRLRAQR